MTAQIIMSFSDFILSDCSHVCMQNSALHSQGFLTLLRVYFGIFGIYNGISCVLILMIAFTLHSDAECQIIISFLFYVFDLQHA